MDEQTLKRINLLPKAQAVTAGDSVFSDEQRQFIAEIYKSLLGKEIPNCSCRNRYADALIEICTTFKIKTNMSKCRYQLFAGVIIWLGTECYSNHNLTDEVAEEYLRRFPEAREKEFQAWPQEDPKDNSDYEEKVEYAKKCLEESKEALVEYGPKITDESSTLIGSCLETLEEVIEGGDITNIESALEGLKQAWDKAEKRPEEPTVESSAEGEGNDTDDADGNGDGQGEGTNEPNQETQEKPKGKGKGKKGE